MLARQNARARVSSSPIEGGEAGTNARLPPAFGRALYREGASGQQFEDVERVRGPPKSQKESERLSGVVASGVVARGVPRRRRRAKARAAGRACSYHRGLPRQQATRSHARELPPAARCAAGLGCWQQCRTTLALLFLLPRARRPDARGAPRGRTRRRCSVRRLRRAAYICAPAPCIAAHSQTPATLSKHAPYF